jgi:hypothetical protein
MKAELTLSIMYQWIPKHVARSPLAEPAGFGRNAGGEYDFFNPLKLSGYVPLALPR